MSGGAGELEAARAYLQSGGSSSVYAHLQSLLLRIVKEKPNEPLRHFEALSVQIKQAKLRAAAKDGAAAAAATTTGVLGVDVPCAPLVQTDAGEKNLLSHLQRTLDLIQKAKKLNEDGEEEEEEEPEPNAATPDLQHEAYLLQQAGQHARAKVNRR